MVHMQKYKVIPWCMSKKQAYIMACLKKNNNKKNKVIPWYLHDKKPSNTMVHVQKTSYMLKNKAIPWYSTCEK